MKKEFNCVEEYLEKGFNRYHITANIVGHEVDTINPIILNIKDVIGVSAAAEELRYTLMDMELSGIPLPGVRIVISKGWHKYPTNATGKPVCLRTALEYIVTQEWKYHTYKQVVVSVENTLEPSIDSNWDVIEC